MSIDDAPSAIPSLAPHNLPLPLTSFVGREQQIGEVKQLLARTRLLTLTGAGGCGKTRLALRVAGDVLDRFPEGVWLVELAPLGDGALVAQMIATTIGVREVPGHAALDNLTDALRMRSLLLLIDNCEHLVGAGTLVSAVGVCRWLEFRGSRSGVQ